MEYFEQLEALLKQEQQTDRAQYEATLQHTSIHQRRNSGIAWYPVAIRQTDPLRGDYLSVTLERTTHTDMPHQLRWGMPAVLFSAHNAQEHRLQGLILSCKNNNLRLQVYTDELPDWTRQGKLGVDLLFDDNSYKEMQAAIKEAHKQISNDSSRLLQVLLAQKKPNFEPTEIATSQLHHLNKSQLAAVQKIVDAQDLAIVHGPPGTGKTTTLVAGIKAMVAHGAKKILVCAPSNVAVDVLAQKLHEENISVLRIGNPVRVQALLHTLTLEHKIDNHSTNKNIKQLRRRASDLLNMAHQYKRNFGKAERDQRKLIFAEAHNILADIDNMEQYIVNDILEHTQIICATPVGCTHYQLKALQYDVAVIDEAGQALEPACWIPILKAQKLILAGDHLQLPPTIKSIDAAQKGLATTLLEKCVQLHPEAVTLLNTQYRMNEKIMQFSNEQFYDNKLAAHSSVKHHTLWPSEQALLFVDTAGCGYNEVVSDTAVSNPEEAALAFRILNATLSNAAMQNVLPLSIAIISPYKEQTILLQNELQHYEFCNQQSAHITINTVDGFQGQEKDLVIISLVRSNDDGTVGFLADTRRMNVAMTRARKKLIIVGDSATLAQHKFYDELILYTQSIDSYGSGWEWM